MPSGSFHLLYLQICVSAIYTSVYIYKYIHVYLIDTTNCSSLQRSAAKLKSWQTD